MSQFWQAMAPWLIMAALVGPIIALSLWLIPSDEWSAGIIGEWADSEGLRIRTIDQPRWIDRFGSNTSAVYRVRVLDEKGHERECKAVVGRFMPRATFPNLKITWLKPR